MTYTLEEENNGNLESESEILEDVEMDVQEDTDQGINGAQLSDLENAVNVLLNASKDDFNNLNKEVIEKLKTNFTQLLYENVLNNFEKLNDEIRQTNNLVKKCIADNEEFKVTSKTTLQNNVQILEAQVKENQFNKILKPIAFLYSNYAFMLDAPIDEVKTRSNIEGILEEIESFLLDYNVEKIEASIGDDFDPLCFKISKRIETNDLSLDKKVAAIKQPGWKKDRLVLVPLRADMYVYVAEKSNVISEEEGEN